MLTSHKSFLSVFCTVLFFFCSVPIAFATTDLYVAPTGSDTNAGTQTSPFKTILKASQVALPDTIVHVAPGIYTGGFKTTTSGTATGRITYLSDVKWGAKIVAPSNSTNATGFDNRGAYVTIDGFEMNGIPSSGTLWSVGINVAGTGDIVQNCLVYNIYNTGVANSSGGAGILLDSWYGFNDMQALNNIVHHVGPSGSGGDWYHGIYQTATGAIKNNITYANSGFGIHMWHDANHITVTSNTSFGNGHGFVVGGGDYVNTSGPADYVTFANNIAFDNTGMGFDEEGQNGTHNIFTNNLSFQNGTNWRLNTNTHTNDVTADPQFVNYIRAGGGDYHLQRTSPAIDMGTALYAPPLTDFDGTTRPQGVGYDIGAYEYVSGGTTSPDTQIPTTPTALTAAVISASQITLSWTASIDDVGVAGYRVYRDGIQIAIVLSGTSYGDTGLTAATSYSYAVSAYDAAGNNSAQSISVSTTTQPAVPQNKFIIGDRIRVSSGPVNVRSKPSTDRSSKIRGTQATGALGTVIDGPSVASGYTWWKINYNSGADGWSAENYLQKI
jgi:hypothetical protein